jgi:hypothetical protein
MVVPEGNDTNWALGSYNAGQEFWMQAKFYGLNGSNGATGQRGFRVYDVGNNVVQLKIDDTGQLTVAGSIKFGDGTVQTTAYTGGSSYSDSNVAAYLTANPPTGTYTNSNVASYLIANPQTGTFSNANVASYLTSGNVTAAWVNGNLTIGSGSVVARTIPATGSTATAGEPSYGYGGTLAVFASGNFSAGSISDVQAGWTVTDNQGFSDTILSVGDPFGGAIKTTSANWPNTGGRTYVFRSADYALSTPTDLTLKAGSSTWIFGANGSTTFPDRSPVSISGNLTVGNLFVNGTTTTINTASYSVEDNVIQIAANNPADILDIGFVGHRTVGSTLEHTGLVRDASVGNWKLFSNVTAQPGNTVDFTNAVLDNLELGTVTGTDFKFANGVSILSTVAPSSTYSNANVASYLVDNPQAGTYSNSNVASYLVANPQTGTYSNTNVAAYLTIATFTTTGNITAGNVTGTHYGNTIGTTATYTANITAANFIGNLVGTVTGNVTGTLTGNVTGTTPNVDIVAGGYTSTFNNVGTVTMPNVTVAGNVTASGIAPFYAPNRPAFRVYGNTSTVYTAGTTISTQAVDYNQGSYYNNGTGIFTAPSSGLYHAYGTVRIATNNGLNQVTIVKNNTVSGANVIAFWETDTNTGTAVHFSLGGYAQMSAGDTLRMKVLSGNVQFDTNDSWGVTYIG